MSYGNIANVVRNIARGINLTEYLQKTPSPSAVYTSSNTIKEYVSEKIAKFDNLVNAFQTLENVPDSLIDKSVITFNDLEENIEPTDADAYWVEIDGETAAQIIDGFNTISDGDAASLVDDNGVAYNFFDHVNNVASDTYDVMLASFTKVHSLSECVIVRNINTGKYYLNSLVRSTNLFANISVDVSDKPISAQLDEIISVFFSKVKDVPTTIIGKTRMIADHFGIPYDDRSSVKWIINELCCPNHVANIQSGLESIQFENGSFGFFSTIFDLIKSVSVTSTMYTMIANTLASLPSIRDVSSMLASVSEYANSKISSVSQLANNIVSAFNRGESRGVISYLITIFSQKTDMSNDDDGVFKFTDNDALIPKAFIADAIPTITGALVSIGQGIAMTIGGWIGAVISVAGSLVSSIVQFFSNKKDNTYASVEFPITGGVPCSPIGAAQLEIPCTMIQQDLSEYISDNGVAIVMTVGGYLFIGPSSHEGYYNCEFHALLDWSISSDIFRKCFADFFTVNNVGSIGNVTQNVFDSTLCKFSEHYNEALSKLQHEWSANANKIVANSFNISNEPNGHLSMYKDYAVRCGILINTALFFMYCACIQGAMFPGSGSFGVTKDNDSEVTYYRIGAYPYCWISLAYLLSCTDDYREPSPFQSNPNSYNFYKTVSWAHLLTIVPPWAQTGYNPVVCLTSNYYFGRVSNMPAGYVFPLQIPQYDANSFTANLIGFIAVTAVAIATIVVATVLIRNKIKKSRAMNEAQVQNAHQSFVDNPTEDTYKAYRKAVFKNNFWANFNGGTKFDYVNYWNGDPRGDDGHPSFISSLFSGKSDESGGIITAISDLPSDAEIEVIRRLIAGN